MSKDETLVLKGYVIKNYDLDAESFLTGESYWLEKADAKATIANVENMQFHCLIPA